MSEIVVCRPVGGITVNSEMEFVLDGEGGVRVFDGMGTVRKTLYDAGCPDEEMAHMKFLESCGTCVRCKSPLFTSLLPDYKSQCFTCDEDFYGFEQEPSMDRYFAYLNQLRESGVTNMFGAVPYLQEHFPELAKNRDTAVQVLKAWMEAYRK